MNGVVKAPIMDLQVEYDLAPDLVEQWEKAKGSFRDQGVVNWLLKKREHQLGTCLEVYLEQTKGLGTGIFVVYHLGKHMWNLRWSR